MAKAMKDSVDYIERKLFVGVVMIILSAALGQTKISPKCSSSTGKEMQSVG